MEEVEGGAYTSYAGLDGGSSGGSGTQNTDGVTSYSGNTTQGNTFWNGSAYVAGGYTGGDSLKTDDGYFGSGGGGGGGIGFSQFRWGWFIYRYHWKLSFICWGRREVEQ